MDPAREHGSTTAAPAALRLFVGAADRDGTGAASRRTRSSLGPHSTLRQFFDEWYLPICLTAEGADLKTVANVRTAVDRWEELTDDPSLDEIDAFTLAELKAAFRAHTWRKSPSGPCRPYKPGAIVKHLKNIRSMLERCGPTFDRERPTAGLVDAIPYLRITSVKRLAPADTFTLDEARAIVRQVQRIDDYAERTRWLVRLSLMFYCGLRIGSTLAVDRSMLVDRAGRMWLVVDGDEIKTGNSLCLPLHAELMAAIHKLPPLGAHDLLAPWARHRRTLDHRHERLQIDAGVKKPLGFHAWRRTFAEQMSLVGADAAELASQAGLDHARARTTRESYCNARALLVDLLPPLVLPTDDVGQARLF